MKLLIIGATGLVGESLISLLENSALKIEKICFISSEKSRNKLIKFKDKYYFIKSINDINLANYTHACVLTSSEVSKQITPSLLFNNLVVIDNSSAYRTRHNLTVPELNFKKNKRIYVNPNCCVIQSIIPLFHIDKKYDINEIIFNTYQSCSGGGYSLLDDFHSNKIKNCIPFIGDILLNNSTDEEEKMIKETNKLLNKSIPIYSNCVRVPTENGHLVNIIFKVNNCTINDILEVLKTNTIYLKSKVIPNINSDSKIYTTRLKQLNFNTFSFYTYANNLSPDRRAHV